MAVVRPFRAVRYSEPSGADISALTSPPYDVIDPEQRARLLASEPHNVVALELPEGPLDPSVPGNRYETSGKRWRSWLTDGVLTQDAEPAVYVLEQRYSHADVEIARCAFVVAVDLEPFSAGVVLPHERTIPKTTEDRLRLTRATEANLSQVFGLFADPERATQALVERARRTQPLASATDEDGVVSTIWALQDPADHALLSKQLADKPIFIADGHHRYTTALAYRDERRAEEKAAAADPAYDSIMMALVDMDDSGLTIWPTHRIADSEVSFDADAFWKRLGEGFEIEEVAGDPGRALGTAASERPAFLIRTRGGCTKIARLRADADTSVFPGGSSEVWRALDVAVLQELVLSPLLGIHPDRPETLERLRFVKDADQALEMSAEHDVVFILNATRMDQVAEVALGGETMPQKSTYFYPKLLSGMLFKRLDE